jgi:hypothetical protein
VPEGSAQAALPGAVPVRDVAAAVGWLRAQPPVHGGAYDS